MGTTRFLSPSFAVAAAIVLASTARSFAQDSSSAVLPRILYYQGVLADMGGVPVPDGEYPVTIRLYDVPDGGKELWQEQLNVGVYGGLFEVYVGMNKPLLLPFDRAYWLAVQVEGESEMLPRTLLVSAPYAFRSLAADKAAGLTPGATGAVVSLNGGEGEMVLVGENGIQVKRSGDTIWIVGSVPALSSSVAAATAPVNQIFTNETSGVISVTLGGKDFRTGPPVAGVLQSLGSIVVSNPHITEQSIVHANVVEKEDDGTAPNPEQALFLIDVDNRSRGSFTLHIGMIPTVTGTANFQPGDVIRVGYTIVNTPK